LAARPSGPAPAPRLARVWSAHAWATQARNSHIEQRASATEEVASLSRVGARC
jgi:hypothetical protein